MNRIFLVLLTLLLCAIPSVRGAHDDCLEAVKITIRAAGTMNDQWHHSCLTAVTVALGKALCDTTYAEFKKAFH